MTNKKPEKRQTKKIPKEKLDAVKELSNLINTKKTILIASIKNIPTSQFQEIVKKLRKDVVVKVPKKNLMFRAINEVKDEKIKEKLKEHIQENIAILFSDIDCFELALKLVENRNPAKAKAGQEAPEDIEVSAGPTDLVPGPAISELGALGIQIQIDKGKINIKESKVIVKKGNKISPAAAEVMNKLGIKPFTIGLIPLSAFDIKDGKVYSEIKINREETLKELKEAYSRALPFAVQIGYSCNETIKFIIAKAGRHEKAISNLLDNKKGENGNE